MFYKMTKNLRVDKKTVDKVGGSKCYGFSKRFLSQFLFHSRQNWPELVKLLEIINSSYHHLASLLLAFHVFRCFLELFAYRLFPSWAPGAEKTVNYRKKIDSFVKA